MTDEERILGAMVMAALKRGWAISAGPMGSRPGHSRLMVNGGDATFDLNLTGGTEMLIDAEGPDEIYDAMIDAGQNACEEIWKERPATP